MNNENPFMGLGVALVTPFTANGSIDWEKFAELIEFQIENGTDYLCILGTTAETPTLTDDEKLKIVQSAIKQINGRIPIMVGCSSNCTAAVLNQIKQYEIEGVDGILTAVPYYNKPSQEGIYQHFKAIAENCKKPIVLYNVPGRTGVNMTATTTLRIANEFKNVIAVKEASGNLEQFKEIVAGSPEHFKVISGDDGLAFEAMQNGVIGVISVMGNAIPKTFSTMIHHLQNNEIEAAATIHEQLKPLYSLLFTEGNPPGVKDLMASRGMIENVLRLPLVPVSKATHEQTVKAFENIVI
ncbi:MAG: 4-hydroxy-tetrahydrodipicolinate synthase [Bacteroidaceae bacterium]|nr:4-hydroxy-tetrahydrodipicolinate synthase [Bacteroidaceae bacterium]